MREGGKEKGREGEKGREERERGRGGTCTCTVLATKDPTISLR